MSQSSSDDGLWQVLKLATPLIAGCWLIDRGTSWEILLTQLTYEGGVSLGVLLSFVALFGCWVIYFSLKRGQDS